MEGPYDHLGSCQTGFLFHFQDSVFLRKQSLRNGIRSDPSTFPLIHEPVQNIKPKVSAERTKVQLFNHFFSLVKGTDQQFSLKHVGQVKIPL